MEEFRSYHSILDFMNQPAFVVRDGSIVQVNQSARNRMLEAGMPIASLIVTGQEELAEYQSGILYLTLKSADQVLDATVTDLHEGLLFVLDQDGTSPELRAMSLAAMQLRSPMSSLLMSLQALNAEPALQENKDLKEQLSRMNRGLYQMLRMVSNMSDASRYSETKLSNLELVDAQSAFREIFLKAQSMLSGISQAVEFHDLTEREFCMLDMEKLERAVYNLLSNAVKYTPADGRITVHLTKKGNHLCLTVENTAEPGLSPLRSDLFRMFAREPSLEDGRTGIGLGMMLVRLAASAHEGTVLVSQTESTTCVKMQLAIRKPGSTMLSSPIMRVDYAGERDHGLVELSDILPSQLFLNE